MKTKLYTIISIFGFLLLTGQKITGQTIDIGTYYQTFEYSEDFTIISSYTSKEIQFTTEVPMRIVVSFCGSNNLDGYFQLYGGGTYASISFALDMCASFRIIDKDNVPPGTYTLSYTNYSSSGNLKMSLKGFGGVQPGNSFNDPINIGTYNADFNYTDTKNTEYYTNSFDGRTTNDVFYKLVLSVPMDITIRFSGDVKMGYYSILSSSGNLLSSQLVPHYYTKENLPAGIYYIVAEGYTLNGAISTIVEGKTYRDGDLFIRPIDVGVYDGDFLYSDTRNTGSGYTDNFLGMPTNDIFYRFSITKPMDIVISHCGSALSDTYMHLLSSNGAILAYNDNYTGTGQCSNTNQANIRVQNLPSGVYFVVSEGKSANGSINTRIEGKTVSGGNNTVPISHNVNYITTITPLDKTPNFEITNLNGLVNINSSIGYNMSIQYFDGLGRPIQLVERGITPSGKDLTTLSEYDLFSRKEKVWLAGQSTANGAYDNPEAVKRNSITLNNNDQSPFSHILYEKVPKGRVLEQYGPGSAWHAGGKSVRTGWLFNTSSGVQSCAWYIVAGDNSLQRKGVYDAPELFVTCTTGEDEQVSYTFTDKLGQVVLVRVMNGSISNDTYYVYDDFGNLRYVLPPPAADALTATTTWNDDNATLKNYAYIYKYDERNRCTKKKFPGCEPVLMKYDQANRLIFSQDGNQQEPSKNEWTFYLYDVFGRPVVTGTCPPQTFASFEGTVVNATYNGGAILGGYTITPSLTGTVKLMTVNYYDDYRFRKIQNAVTDTTKLRYTSVTGYDTHFGDNKANGLLTGTRTYQLSDPAKYTVSALYYDHRGRVVQTRASNHLGGYDYEYFACTFTGKVKQRQQVHSKGTQTETETYYYDYGTPATNPTERLLSVSHKLNSAAQVTLAQYTYDDVGRVKTKKLGTEISTYHYNVRSWLTQITGTKFNQTLTYNAAVNGVTPAKALYNGNTITYVYDGAGSKLSVAYKSGSTTTKTEYAGNKVYKNGTLSMILTEEGYATLSGTTPTYYYYLKDHQGNNRVVINQGGTVQQVNHYYAFGGLFGEGIQTPTSPTNTTARS